MKIQKFSEFVNESKSMLDFTSYQFVQSAQDWFKNIFDKLGYSYVEKAYDATVFDGYVTQDNKLNIQNIKTNIKNMSKSNYTNIYNGYFDRYKSCYSPDINDVINDLKQKLNDDKNIGIVLFSTLCEYLEADGYDDPDVEWRVTDFRAADLALVTIMFNIKNKI